MCGRFAVGLPPKSIAEHFQLDSFPDFSGRFNIAPTQDAPTISRGTKADRHSAVIRKWGLIPGWAKDSKIGAKMFNARAETLSEKPSFRNAFTSRRCLVPASGFYEWHGKGNSRQPFFIRLKDSEILAFAGLWERWNSGDGTALESFTIVTTAANELVKPIHDRMPVILSPDQYGAWLDPATGLEKASSFLAPYPAVEMDMYEVGRIVNNAANDSPACIGKTSLF